MNTLPCQELFIRMGLRGDSARKHSKYHQPILVAKIEDNQRLITLLRRVSVIQDDLNWRCCNWIASAPAEIANDGKCVGIAQLDWPKIEAFAREYVASKTASGRYRSGADLSKPKLIWDMIENKKTVP
jgi:hypothetical protein